LVGADTWSIPVWVQGVAYFVSLFLVCTAGLLIAALVRPKNRAADIAAGAITGFFCGATAFLLAGWIGIIPSAVNTIQADLLQLSEAAFQGRAEGLLEKYPDLRKVPARERGKVLSAKLRGDLIAGIPPGVWLGALWLFAVYGTMFTMHVMAAGPLLRRHGPRPAVLWPYFERVIPATFLIMLAIGLAAVAVATRYLHIAYIAPLLLIAHLPLLGLLGLAVTSTWRGWVWPVRLLLHASWVLGECLLILLISKGVLVFRML
jgi:hypothetical protein